MLSKSKYCAFSQCPRRLWLQTHRPELSEDNSALDARMETGSEIGDLAMGLFGDYTEVTAYRADGQLDLPGMIDHTKRLIGKNHPVIYEAAFRHGENSCTVDILRRETGGYAIYEVKSATHESENYVIDIAYQKYVLEQCGIHVTGTYLVCVNSDYVRGEELDIQQLFKIIDLSDQVALESPLIPGQILLAGEVLAQQDEPDQDISERCETPYHCPFWSYCARHLPEHSVFDLYRMSGKKKFKFYRDGVISYADAMALSDLSSTQQRQIRFQLSDCGTYIDREGIRKFLKTLDYPIYFLDFETMQLAVPQFPGTKPYQQIPFQYSLHYIEEQGGQLKHKEFLAESGEDPRRAIAESLCRDIPMDTCVTAYNKGFECGRLRELAELYPDLAPHLLNIRDNIRDLLTPFQSGFYYNRAMGGSFSIKSVLPAIFPDDLSLDYHNLEGVHNGGEAMALFPRIQDLPPEEQAAARKSLLEYCKLDTYAMVKVWEALQEAVDAAGG